MSTKFIYNLPIISIMTPFILAFVLGLFKEKYIQAKRVLTIIATSISFVFSYRYRPVSSLSGFFQYFCYCSY